MESLLRNLKKHLEGQLYIDRIKSVFLTGCAFHKKSFSENDYHGVALEKPQKTSWMHLYCNSLTFDWIQADSSDVNQFVFSRKYNKTLTQVCFASFTERAPPSDGVSFERPQETSWMLDLSRNLPPTQNYIMSTHILLSVFGESCKSQPQTRKVPLSRVSSANRSAGRKSFRQFADQFLPQQFVESSCCPTEWRWK